MNEIWNKFWEQIEKTDSALDTFIKNTELPPLPGKYLKKFISEWNALKKEADDLDIFFTAPEDEEMKLPFDDKNFTEMWNRWKNYLKEQHGHIMRSRSEKSALELLDNLSGKNKEKAIYILRFAMAGRYKNFFYVDENTAKSEAKETSQSSFD